MESTDCGYLCSYEKVNQDISVCSEILKMKSDSFQVDMEPFLHLTNKDYKFNSRSNLLRSLSKKGEEKKKMTVDSSIDNERDTIFSPKASGNMLEASTPVSTGTSEPQTHHQISIITAATTTTGIPSTKSKLVCKKSSSFKQTSIINPTRILFFFATLSSMGTILLIYFTLSMAKYNGDKKLLA